MRAKSYSSTCLSDTTRKCRHRQSAGFLDHVNFSPSFVLFQDEPRQHAKHPLLKPRKSEIVDVGSVWLPSTTGPPISCNRLSCLFREVSSPIGISASQHGALLLFMQASLTL